MLKKIFVFTLACICFKTFGMASIISPDFHSTQLDPHQTDIVENNPILVNGEDKEKEISEENKSDIKKSAISLGVSGTLAVGMSYLLSSGNPATNLVYTTFGTTYLVSTREMPAWKKIGIGLMCTGLGVGADYILSHVGVNTVAFSSLGLMMTLVSVKKSIKDALKKKKDDTPEVDV
jgi:hypothetical protein